VGNPVKGFYSRNAEKKVKMRADAKTLGLYVREYKTDDGSIEVRMFSNPKSDFFSGGHVYHARGRGVREAIVFLAGYRAGKESEGWRKG